MFRIVLTDIQMPEFDGFQLAERLIALQKHYRENVIHRHENVEMKTDQEIPIIALTANSEE